MTILIEQPELTMAQAEENNEQITTELVLDGGFPLPKPLSQAGFTAPDINSYGHSFRSPFRSPLTFFSWFGSICMDELPIYNVMHD